MQHLDVERHVRINIMRQVADPAGLEILLGPFEVVFQHVEIDRRQHRGQDHEHDERGEDEGLGPPPEASTVAAAALARVRDGEQAAGSDDGQGHPQRTRGRASPACRARASCTPSSPAPSAIVEGQPLEEGACPPRAASSRSDQVAQADRGRRDQQGRQQNRHALGQVLDVARARASALPRSDSRNDVSGTTCGQRLENEPAPAHGDVGRQPVLLALGRGSIKNHASHASSSDRQREQSPTSQRRFRTGEARGGACLVRSMAVRGFTESARWSKARTPPHRRPAARSWWAAPLATSRIMSKQPPSHRFHRLAFQDRAGVHVHVGDHPLVHRRVGGELDARRGLQAQHAAAAGREDQHVGPAGDQARWCTAGRSRAYP